MSKIQFRSLAMAMIGAAAVLVMPAKAAWVISSLDPLNPNVIDFESSIGHDLSGGAGSDTDAGDDVWRYPNTPAGANYHLVEHDHGGWQTPAWNYGALSAEAWSTYGQIDSVPTGSTATWSPYSDANSDSDLDDNFIVSQKAEYNVFGSNGMVLGVANGTRGDEGITLRVLNDTGLTQTDWDFTLDAWYDYGGRTDNLGGTFTLEYATSDNPTFTAFDTFAVPDNNTGSGDIHSIGEMGGLFSASVDAGEYLFIRAFMDAGTGSGTYFKGTGIITDNWTLVPEPSAFALLLAGFGLLMSRRRRRG